MHIGMVLLGAAEWDARFGRVMNTNPAEYLVPMSRCPSICVRAEL